MLFCQQALAQKQASFWLNRNYSLNFNTFPPTPISLTAASLYTANRATVADTLGNLLFYTDGLNYYDREGQLLPGQTQITPTWGTTHLPMIIAPVPGSTTQYYSFMVRFPLNYQTVNFDNTLRYSIIDMAGNNGKGELLQKNVVLADHHRDGFTLIKTPDDTVGYWLVGQNFSGGENLLAYRVSATGIASQPVITRLGGFTSQSLLKASPDGQFLTAADEGWDGHNRLNIYRFHSQTGTFSLFRQIVRPAPLDRNQYPQSQVYLREVTEFSPDSRFLYVFEDSVNTNLNPPNSHVFSAQTLVAFDLTAPTDVAFQQSREVIHRYEASQFLAPFFIQLTPQKKIVLSEFKQKSYFSVIHQPKACGVGNKQFEYAAFEMPGDYSLSIPHFPAWYFYEPRQEEYDFAGKDTAICPNQSIRLGTVPRPGYQYQWSDVPGLSQRNTPNAIFQAGTYAPNQTDTVRLSLRITDPTGCISYDSVKVVVLPVKAWKIQGSRSVCPGVQEVSYWIENGWSGRQITWQVSGGTLVAGQGTDKIRVNWLQSNLQASVSAVSLNERGCQDQVASFPVKVFKVLDTETPRGRDTLRCRQWVEDYQILPTRGSAYNWHVINGQIRSGQGTHRVSIQWDENMEVGKVWLEENVNTELEICFGRSDTLRVVNPKVYGGENVVLQSVSGILEQDDQLLVQYKIHKPVFYQETLTLQRREVGQTDWVPAGSTRAADARFLMGGQALSSRVFEYRLAALTICGDSAFSSVHRNVLLRGAGDTATELIGLNWNPYTSWEDGPGTYEVFRLVDAVVVFQPKASTRQTLITLPGLTDGFRQCFYVRAVSEDGSFASLSNRLCLDFENPLFLPNVITPNGDGLNETWHPRNLHLYTPNRLHIYNRWGHLVYESQNYDGSWSGDNLPNGVYFYELLTAPGQRPYKGSVSILR